MRRLQMTCSWRWKMRPGQIRPAARCRRLLSCPGRRGLSRAGAAPRRRDGRGELCRTCRRRGRERRRHRDRPEKPAGSWTWDATSSRFSSTAARWRSSTSRRRASRGRPCVATPSLGENPRARDRAPPGDRCAADPADPPDLLHRPDRAREPRAPADRRGAARVSRGAAGRRRSRDGRGLRAEPARPAPADDRSPEHRRGARRAREGPRAGAARHEREEPARAGRSGLRQERPADRSLPRPQAERGSPRRSVRPCLDDPAGRGAAPRARDHRLGRAGAREGAALDRRPGAPGGRPGGGRRAQGGGARDRRNPGLSGAWALRRPRPAARRAGEAELCRHQSRPDPRSARPGAAARLRSDGRGRAERPGGLLHRVARRPAAARQQCGVRAAPGPPPRGCCRATQGSSKPLRASRGWRERREGASFTVGTDLDGRLAAVTSDGDAAYSLGFSTSAAAGEKDHKIEVRALRAGARGAPSREL